MHDPTNCRVCGTPLPGGGQLVGCPGCLLRASMSQAAAAAPGLEDPGYLDPGHGRPPETPGTMVGRYLLLEEIGEGGFAIVYRAEQTVPVTRHVALKVLKPGMDTREVVARFEAERQALAMMDHLHIAHVYDGGTTDSGRPYFVMELVNGVPLTTYCDNQHLTTRERLELFLDVIAAVQHAHQKGIIHRDLKPSNILVSHTDGKPVVKVIDFGIAKALGGELTGRTIFTSFGRLIGTPEYMSPEQTEPNVVDVDTRSDVYGLGVVLYELLTGRTPLDPKHLRAASHSEIQRLICETDPPKPSTRLGILGPQLLEVAARRGTEPARLSRQLHGDLDWVVMKALEKDRTRRYPSVSGLAADLQRFLLDDPVSARPPSIRYRFTKFAHRNKTGLAVVTLVTVILIAASAVSIWEAVRARQARTEALEQLRQASLSAARALRLCGQSGRRFEALEALQTAAEIRPGADLRDEAVSIWGVADLQPTKSWPTTADRNDLAAIAPDFSCHAIGQANGSVTVLPNDPGGEILAQLPGLPEIPVSLLRFSPDSRLLAIGHATNRPGVSEVVIWDWRQNTRLGVIAGVTGDAFDFSPDASIAAAGCGEEVVLVDSQTGVRIRGWTGPPGGVASLRFRPDGHALAVVSLTTDEVSVSDLEQGLTAVHERFDHPQAIAWHRDCCRLAVACQGNVTIWNTIEVARKVVIPAAPMASIDRVAWSHASELLASTGPRQPVTIHDANLGETLVSAHGDARDLRFSPDDTRLGLTWDPGRLSQFEVADGRIARHAPGNGDLLLDSAWHPSGAVLATLSAGSLRFWNHEMRDVGRLPVTHGHTVDFTADAMLVIDDTVRRFPCRLAGQPPVLQLGHPVVLAPRHDWQGGDTTADGRWLAVAGHGRVTMFDLENRGHPRELADHPGADQAALSPGGEWLATATQQGSGMKVWAVASGHLAADFPDYGPCRIAFSHDGKWLAVAADGGYHLHRVETWRMEHKIPRTYRTHPGWFAWSPRDTVIAVAPEDYTLAIHDAEDFSLLASPQFEQQRPLNFSPDGSLLTTTDPGHRIHLWNLALLRAKLDSLGADLSLPLLPASTSPLVEAVVLGETNPRFPAAIKESGTR